MPRGKTAPVKSKKKKSPKQKSRSQLVKELDMIFSRYVRKRDSDKYGYCACITCGKKHQWSDGSKMNAGHFMSRGKFATRWVEENVNAQCVACNKWQAGRQYEHGIKIDEKWGDGTAERLLIQSNLKGPSVQEIKELLDLYTKKFEQL